MPFYIILLLESKAIMIKDGLTISQIVSDLENAAIISTGMLTTTTPSPYSEQEQCMIITILTTKLHGVI